MKTHPRSLRRLGAIVAAAAVAFSACGDDAADTSGEPVATAASSGEVTISDAWSRQPADGQTTTAVYAVVHNDTDEAVTITGVTSPVSDRVELHETLADDEGKMTMRQVPDGFEVPAQGTFTFESGGPHVMLFDIDPATYPSVVDVTFEFDEAEPITVSAEVRALIDGESTMDMDMDMDDDSMDDGAMTGDTMDDAHHDDDEHHDDDGHHDDATDDDDAMGGIDGMHGDELDASALHELDEQLAAGNLDAEAQRSVVAEFITAVEAMEPADGSHLAELLVTLHELDDALAAGDLATAAEAASTAHEQAHALHE